MIDGHNDALPLHSRKLVQIVWVIPTLHKNYGNNEKRKIFISSLISKTKLQERQHAFELRQLWDDSDNDVYQRTEHRFTSYGINKYFKALDRTIMFANTVVNKSKKLVHIPFSPPATSGQSANPGGNQKKPNTKKPNPKMFWKFQEKGGQKLPEPPRKPEDDAEQEYDLDNS